MKIKTHLLSLLICVALVASYMPSSGVQGKSMSGAFKEIYTGNMIYFDGTFGPAFGLRRGGRSGSGSEFFTLTVNSYTPEREIAGILNALQKDG